MSIKRFRNKFIVFIGIFFVGFGVFLAWIYLSQVPAILMYHQVDLSLEPKAQKVTPELFERQMALLKEWNFNVVSLDALVKRMESGQRVPRNWVVITFDDGYENNYTRAFPVLKKYGYPATMFVSSDFLNTKDFMNFDQLREMIESGIDIGSHTRFHRYVGGVPQQLQYDEIVNSKKILETNLKRPINYFSYPLGGFDEQAKRIVKEAGYKAAVTTNRGFAVKNKDLYELKRVRLSNSDQNIVDIWVKYAGFANVFRKGKKPH